MARWTCASRAASGRSRQWWRRWCIAAPPTLWDARQLSLNIPVALTEALSNAILRGNGEDAAKTVRVRVEFSEREIVVEVEDEGTGFDLEACTEDPTTPENLEREDGRGLFLMQALVDRVERYRADGNVVRLTLRRKGHAA